jgi:hypothetical protein
MLDNKESINQSTIIQKLYNNSLTAGEIDNLTFTEIQNIMSVINV